MIAKRNSAVGKTIKGKSNAKPKVKYPRHIKHIRLGIWLYFLLIIFEGALRKWVLPSLSAPLLIIRDPIALYILFVAYQRNLVPKNTFLTTIIVVGVLSLFTAVLFGHGNILVAIYGDRTLLLHFPLMFVIGRVFTRDDVVEIGKVTLWITIMMTVLIALQFYSPQTAWVNRSVGGDEGVGFGGALGFSRPPGTFSFTNGCTMFYGFATAFVFYFAIENKIVNKIILFGAAASLLAAIPLSISRGLFFQVGLSLVFLLGAVARKPKYLGRIIIGAVGFGILLLILSKASFFNTSMEAFTARFTNANESEGGVQGVFLDRFLGGMLAALTQTYQPFFGLGIGLGTNVAGMLLTGQRGFLVGEGEWGRIIGELGLMMGLTVIFVRVAFGLSLLRRAYLKLASGDLLPWLLASFGFITVGQALWAQPTALGFSTLIGGLLLASLNSKKVMVKRLRPAISKPSVIPNDTIANNTSNDVQ